MGFSRFLFSKIDILDREFEIIISRVICRHFGKTHAILIQDLIPYSLFPHDTIISALSDLDSYIVSSPHRSFLKNKYSFLDFSIINLSVRLLVDLFLSCFILRHDFWCFFLLFSLSSWSHKKRDDLYVFLFSSMDGFESRWFSCLMILLVYLLYIFLTFYLLLVWTELISKISTFLMMMVLFPFS